MVDPANKHRSFSMSLLLPNGIFDRLLKGSIDGVEDVETSEADLLCFSVSKLWRQQHLVFATVCTEDLTASSAVVTTFCERELDGAVGVVTVSSGVVWNPLGLDVSDLQLGFAVEVQRLVDDDGVSGLW